MLNITVSGWNDMNVKKIEVRGYGTSIPIYEKLNLGTYGSYGIEKLHFVLDEDWKSMDTVDATFHNIPNDDGVTMLVDSTGMVDVPPEATAKPTQQGTITLRGVKDGVQIFTVNIGYRCGDRAKVPGKDATPTPSEWEQFVSQVKGDADRAESAAQQAEDATKEAKQAAENAASSEKSTTQSAANALQSKNAAAQSAKDAAAELGKVQNASTEALTGIGAAKQSALTDIVSAKDSVVSGINSAGATQTGKVENAGTEALKSLDAAKTSAVNAVAAAGTKAEQDIGATKETALGAISDAQGQAIQAVQQTGTNEVGKVNAAGSAQTKAIQDEGTKQTQAVTEAGDTKLAEINAANALVPTPAQADAGKAIIVKPDGSGYELGEVQTDAYTKAESDAKYAPIEAAIRPTVSGNPATLEHSVAWAMQGLSVYGKSTQDGEPSPDSPVPIVSAGESGSIAVTVSNGADQSQQLVISTPNGLPGIPVDFGGNYTDSTGQRWLCDYVDFARGVMVSFIAQHTFTGDENFTDNIGAGTSFSYNIGVSLNRNGGLSNKGIYQVPGTSEKPEGNFYIGSTTIGIYTTKSLQEFKSELKSWYTSGAPTVVFYGVSDPTETPLSDEELAAYAALRSYNGTTIVSTEAPVAGLSARYVADGAAYIDSKIQDAITEAVTQAVALTGGNA